MILSLFGKHLLRNASEQVTQGMLVEHLTDAQVGDLVFFDHEDGKISHVGLVLSSPLTDNRSPFTVIHCSGRVKVEKLDETGIFNTEQGGYSHHLVCIRRI